MKLTRSLAKLAFWPVVLGAVSASAQQAPANSISSTTSSGYAIAFPTLTTPNLTGVVSNFAALPANFITGPGTTGGTAATSSAGGGIGPVAGTATGSTGATSSLGGSIGGVGSAPGGLGTSSAGSSSFTSALGAGATPSGPVYLDVPGMGPGETL